MNVYYDQRFPVYIPDAALTEKTTPRRTDMTRDDFMVMNGALLPLKKKLFSQLLKFTFTLFL